MCLTSFPPIERMALSIDFTAGFRGFGVWSSVGFLRSKYILGGGKKLSSSRMSVTSVCSIGAVGGYRNCKSVQDDAKERTIDKTLSRQIPSECKISGGALGCCG